MVVPVDERDPGASVLGVPALRLVEDAADDRRGIVHDAGHQPLVGCHRSGHGLAAFLLGRGQDVGGRARGRGDVVDRADLGHALAVAFLPLGQPGRELRAGLGGRGGRRRPQRVGTHHDALAVAGEHEHVTGRVGRRLPAGVERVEVGGGSLGELLHLPFADLLSRPPLDRLDRAVERAAGGLDRREPAQPVGVPLVGKVEHPVGRVQVRLPACPVGDPGHPDLPEHRREPPRVAGLGAAVAHPLGVDDRRDPRLPCGA
jgi:hypothetical protein